MCDATSIPKQSVKLAVLQPLRARDIVVLVRTAMRYASDITVAKHDCQADGKSYFDLLALNAHPGDRLQVIARGN